MSDQYFSIRPSLTGLASAPPRRMFLRAGGIAALLAVIFLGFGVLSLEQIPISAGKKFVWVLGRTIEEDQPDRYIVDIGSGEIKVHVKHGPLEKGGLVFMRGKVLVDGYKPVLWEERRFDLFMMPRSGPERDSAE